MISFRKISKNDLPLILRWRTDPEVTRYMSTDIEFDLEKQTNLTFTLNNESKWNYYPLIKFNNNITINDKAVFYYPPTEHLPYSSINKSKEIEFSQLTVLSKLIKKEKKI